MTLERNLTFVWLTATFFFYTFYTQRTVLESISSTWISLLFSFRLVCLVALLVVSDIRILKDTQSYSIISQISDLVAYTVILAILQLVNN